MTKKDFPSDGADKFIVRLPDGMRSIIAANAKANNRSMNAEVVAMLQQALDGRQPTPSMAELDIKALAKEIAALVAADLRDPQR